ncbi:HET domain containing protein [Elaphomyces granulatus]
MRLLKRNNTGEFGLTKDLLVGDDLPRYAILSHTWGADTEEVSFKDMIDGTGKRKTGYDKIRFCGEQAGRDGLQYFWIDTCCIDKSSSAELHEAINSMFYVKSSQLPWEFSFRKSRWFTRGWTLQELVAPTIVEFFSKEGEQLGNKKSLERHIHEVTGIPVKALQGSPLSDFSVPERMLWSEKRETTRKEDKAYSLLGIFDIYMPLIYGEGRENAFKRLREEMDKASKGTKQEDFSVAFSLSNVSETEQFVAREEELAEIQRMLRGDGSRRIVVLHGLGGIGKTQLTVAYTKRHKDNYSAVFWLNIKDEDSLKQSFAKVAKQILREHPSASRLSNVNIKENIDEVIDAVKAWLSLPNNTRWLMIYDNYDNPKLAGNTDPAAVDICKYLPESYQGSILITTRLSEVKIGHRIRIRKLEDVRDSVKILLNTSRREGLDDGTLNAMLDPDAVKLAKELDGLPLALATAGAYLDQTAISFSDYLGLYKASWAKLLTTSPELRSYEDRMLYSTWQLSFDQVKQRNELSAKLLRLWAYFDNQDLWLELLRHSNSEDPDWIRELTEGELGFNRAVRVLSDHGLVEVDMSSQELVESRGYSIHGCVHSWTVYVLNQEWDYDLAKLALKFVGSHVPSDDSSANKWWLTQRRLLPHAARCSHAVLNGMVIDDGMERELDNLGYLYANQDKLDEAEKMYQRALQGKEKAWGPDHTSTLFTVNNLGTLYADQGKLDEAEKMYQRALQGQEKAWGPDHTSTLNTVNNLGTLYADQGKLDEAEKMYQRALQGQEKAWGPDHTSTLDTVNNLGALYKSQGKLDEAEKMYQRALQGYEKALGPDHTSTLSTVNNLGLLYADQGKLDDAEKMYQRALQGMEKALGPDHTSTLFTVNNLGRLYAKQGKLDEAEKMYQRALQGYEKALGVENVARYRPALKTMWGLGKLFADQGHLDKAKEMYSRAYTGYRAVLGPSSNQCQQLERRIEILPKYRLIYNSSTHDNGGTRAGVEVTANIALDHNEEKKCRSVVRKLMHKLLR